MRFNAQYLQDTHLLNSWRCLRIFVSWWSNRQEARRRSPLIPEFVYGRALSAARHHHNAFLYDTLVKRIAPAHSSNCTTVVSVSSCLNHSGLESFPKASPLSCLCILFHDLSLPLYFSPIFPSCRYIFISILYISQFPIALKKWWAVSNDCLLNYFYFYHTRNTITIGSKLPFIIQLFYCSLYVKSRIYECFKESERKTSGVPNRSSHFKSTG